MSHIGNPACSYHVGRRVGKEVADRSCRCRVGEPLNLLALYPASPPQPPNQRARCSEPPSKHECLNRLSPNRRALDSKRVLDEALPFKRPGQEEHRNHFHYGYGYKQIYQPPPATLR